MNIEVYRDAQTFPCLVTLGTEYKEMRFESRPPAVIVSQDDFDKTVPLLKSMFKEDVSRQLVSGKFKN